MENLYLESAVNRIYEESADFDWFNDVPDNPLKFIEPDVTLDNVERDEDGWPLEYGNGQGEIWVDVSKYSQEEKEKILSNINKSLGGLIFDNASSWCSRRDVIGYLIHCGHEENHFFAQENHVCCMNQTHDEFVEEEKSNSEFYYGHKGVQDRPQIDGGIFLNHLNESEEEKKEGTLKDILTDLKIAPKFLFTFGTGIGGFLGPVTKLLEGSGVHLSQVDIGLLIITAIAFIIQDTDFKKLKEELTRRGIGKHLKSVTDFIKGTQNVINSVLKNVTGATYGLADILGFTFIMVPVTNILTQLIGEYGITANSIGQLFTGLAAGAATYGVKSVIKRLRNKL